MDKEFDENFNDFIEERINQNFSKLSSNEEYQKISKSFNLAYSDFFDTLSAEDKKKLESLYAIFNKISGYENSIAYKIGFSDSIKLSNI